MQCNRKWTSLAQVFLDDMTSNVALLLLQIKMPSVGPLASAIDRRNVKDQLNGVLWFELVDLQFDHNVTLQPQVIEQQVDAVVISVDVDLVLPPNECKARTQL